MRARSDTTNEATSRRGSGEATSRRAAGAAAAGQIMHDSWAELRRRRRVGLDWVGGWVGLGGCTLAAALASRFRLNLTSSRGATKLSICSGQQRPEGVKAVSGRAASWKWWVCVGSLATAAAAIKDIKRPGQSVRHRPGQRGRLRQRHQLAAGAAGAVRWGSGKSAAAAAHRRPRAAAGDCVTGPAAASGLGRQL